MPIHNYQYHDHDYDRDHDVHNHGHYGHYHHGHYHYDDYHHHPGHYHHDDHHHHGHYHHDDHHHHGHYYRDDLHHHAHHYHNDRHHNHYDHPVRPFDPILGHSPVFYLPQSATNFLVVKHGRLPQSYISYNGLDIGVNAEIDEWRDYLAMQDGLKVLILLLLFLILAMPIMGSLYGWFYRRCRNCRTGSKRTCYFCGILLAVAALLMFFFLFFAMLAASQLTKGLEKNGRCTQRSLHRSPRDLYDPNYKDQSDAGDHAEAINDLNEVLKNLHAAKLILEEFQDELPVGKGLAIRFRDALRVVKENLKDFLTSQCNQEECGDFYRDNEIRMLDEGCLHFDRIPSAADLIKSINEILASNFVNYPLMAAKTYRNRTKNLPVAVYKDLHKDDKNLHEKFKASLVEPKVKKKKPAKAIRRFPAVALRRKLGPSWYGSMLGMLLVLMILPILLLIALVVKLYKPNVGNGLICAFLTAVFILFSIPLILVLFFLVHGFLTYNIFCAGYHQVPEKRINPIYYRSNYYPRTYNRPIFNRPIYNRPDDNPPNYNPPNENLPNDNQPNEILTDDYQPVLRSEDTLQRCAGNESLCGDLGLKEFFANMKRDILESLAKIPGNLSSICSQAAAVDRELLRNKLFSYNTSEFTQHMCRELVPEPKPGPLLELISKLGNLTRSVGSPPFLLNQTIRLQVAHKKLGQPLAAIIQRLLGKVKELDHLLSGRNESLATYMSLLLERIKQFQCRDFIDIGLDNGRNESIKSLGQTRHGHHHDDHYYDDYYNDYYYHDDYYHDDHYHDAHHYDDLYHDPSNGGSFDSYRDGLALNRLLRYKDLCRSIAYPMNAIWFWLLPFTLMLLPAISCSHYLRCYCRCCRNVCEVPCSAPCAAPCVDPSAAPCADPSATSCAASSAVSCAAPCAAPCAASCVSPCAAPCASPCCTLPMEFPDCTHCRYLPVIDETNVDQLNFNMHL
ncbi:prominin-like protein isoform X2 [Drosophila kikkawai]|nr:uncharacterized protein LOC108077837 isoform X2 [Drosophila kikkawai]